MIALVSCVAAKRDVASPAEDLYVSPLFRAARRHAERTADQWYILSAEHGVVLPSEEIEPYDVTLNDMRIDARRAWAGRVLAQLDVLIPAASTIALMAGRRYREHLVVQLAARGHVVPTLATWRLGIGSQLRWYATRGAQPE